jgi:hypothetical protein
MGALDSAVAAVYVLFADDPSGLRDHHPSEFHELYCGWEKVYPDVVAYVILV